jgi:agmatinase
MPTYRGNHVDPENIENKFPYSGIPTFYKLQHTKDLKNVDIALTGVPFDQGTTNRSGTRFGPRSIRIASQNYGIYMHSEEGAYDLEQKTHILPDVNLIDYGDVPILPTSTVTNMNMIHNTFKKIIESRVFPVGFGGDHSITFPILEAFDVDFDIIHFDTHLDFIDHIGDVKFSHASPIKRASDLETVNNITQIGIRGFTDRKSNYDEATKYGSKIITAADIFENGIKWTLEEIGGARNIYITLDIDALDISTVPGTGTPEPGGLSYLQIREILQNLPSKGNIIGFDIVEVNPLYDAGNMTSQVASRLALDFLGAIF